MTEIVHKDFFGERLFVGDTVAYSSYEGSGLGKGVVIALTPKMVKIQYGKGYEWKGKTVYSTVLRDPAYVVKNLSNEVTD